MQWQEVRQRYPQQWLLVEAIRAHSEQDLRILEQLAVIAAYPDPATAMQGYPQLHREAPGRELYVFHSSRTTLEVEERYWLGIRGL